MPVSAPTRRLLHDGPGLAMALRGGVVGRVIKVQAAPVGTPWCGCSHFGHHEDRTPTRLRGDARGRDGGVREELVAGV